MTTSAMTQQQQQSNSPPQRVPPSIATLGLWVRVETITNLVLEGQIYAVDETAGCIVLQSPHRPPNALAIVPHKFDIHILKINFIRDINPLPQIAVSDSKNAQNTQSGIPNFRESDTSYEALTTRHVSTPKTLIPLGQVMIEQLQAKERNAVKMEQQRVERLKSGVTSEGLQIFDALGKTMQCRWKGNSIVIMDEVVVAKPYTPENCSIVQGKSGDGPQRLLQRVRKVLEGERRRLGLT